MRETSGPAAVPSAVLFPDPRTGLPALANLSRAAALAVVAGVLADGPEEFALLAGADPADGLPVWLRVALEENLVDRLVVRLSRGVPGLNDERITGGGSFDCPPSRTTVRRLRATAAAILGAALGA